MKFVFMAAVFISLVYPFRSGAFYGEMEIMGGYDNNANRAIDKESTGFTEYRLELGHEFQIISETDAVIFAEGSYQDRFRLSDQNHAGAGVDISRYMFENRFLPGISAGYTMYHDGLNEDSEGDEYEIGARMDWLASARLTLGIELTWIRFDYSKPVEYDIIIPGEPPLGMPPRIVRESVLRKDDRWLTAVQGILYMTPALETGLRIEFENCSSTVEMESYSAMGFQFLSFWEPYNLWGVEAVCAWHRIDYDVSTGGIDRNERIWQVSIEIMRTFDPVDIFVRGEWTDNNSWHELESYWQTVTQCGLIWSF